MSLSKYVAKENDMQAKELLNKQIRDWSMFSVTMDAFIQMRISKCNIVYTCKLSSVFVCVLHSICDYMSEFLKQNNVLPFEI